MKYGRIGANATCYQQCPRVPGNDSEEMIFVTGLAAVGPTGKVRVGAKVDLTLVLPRAET